MAQQSRHRGVSVFSMRLTSTVSVTLVLILLGIAALVGASARNVTDTIKSRVGFVAILTDTVSTEETNNLKRLWSRAPYVSSFKYSSAQDVLNQWQSLNPDEEDLTKLLGVNPFFAEFEVNVRPQYAHPDSLSKIVKPLESLPAIRHIKLNSQMVSSLNSSFKMISLTLAIGAVIMVLIALVLINNTVRLTIYAKRFTIRTMQLVGATDGFIRRPILATNILQGLFAALIALVILGAGLFYASTKYPVISRAVTANDLILISIILVFIGVAVCLSAALFAANKYLRADYDEMYS